MPSKSIKYFVLIAIFWFIIPVGFADLPPDPGGSGPTGNPVGGGSPIGGGFLITMVLSGIYGVKKTIRFRRK